MLKDFSYKISFNKQQQENIVRKPGLNISYYMFEIAKLLNNKHLQAVDVCDDDEDIIVIDTYQQQQ